MRASSTWLLRAWPLLLAGLLLGPALGDGFVLSYDMVWVPDLRLGTTTLGLGTGLPRAVPSDAVVAVLDELVPGLLLQKLVLVGSLAGGAYGVARLCGPGVPGRLVAMTVWVWNPFVVERLVVGHWPVLVGYAVLPWVLVVARHWRGATPPAGLLVLAPLGSLSASAGLATAVAALAGALFHDGARGRRTLLVLGVVAAANAPWVVAGLLHAGANGSPGVGFELFAPRSEGAQPPLLAALSFGGIWNAEVVPSSRTDLRGWLYLLVLAALMVVGFVTARRSRTALRPLLACWLVGFGLVVLTTQAGSLLVEAARVVPSLELLRDGTRLLGLCVPLVAVLAGAGAQHLATRISAASSGAPALTSAALGSVLVLWPVALLPDAAWGVAGRLDAVDYPHAYIDLPARVEAVAPDGARLVLPLSSYRAPPWNGGRTVLDPVPRFVGGDVVSGGGLLVSGRLVPPEDPRERAVLRVLRSTDDGGDDDEVMRRLGALGFGLVVAEPDAYGPGTSLGSGGTSSARAGALLVGPIRAAGTRAVPTTWAVASVFSWAAFVGCATFGAAASVLGAARRRRVRSSAPPVG